MRIFLFLLLCATGCESYDNGGEIFTIQGIAHLNDVSIHSIDALTLSHVAYTNGDHVRIVNGAISVSDTLYPFSVVLDDQEETNVILATFPFTHFDSMEYRCSFRFLNSGVAEICWVRSGKRVYLRKKIT